MKLIRLLAVLLAASVGRSRLVIRYFVGINDSCDYTTFTNAFVNEDVKCIAVGKGFLGSVLEVGRQACDILAAEQENLKGLKSQVVKGKTTR